jgi:hypothetical protein
MMRLVLILGLVGVLIGVSLSAHRRKTHDYLLSYTAQSNEFHSTTGHLIYNGKKATIADVNWATLQIQKGNTNLSVVITSIVKLDD